MNRFKEIQELLQQKADCHARLQLIPYDGSPEIKELNGKTIIICSAILPNWSMKVFLWMEAGSGEFLLQLAAVPTFRRCLWNQLSKKISQKLYKARGEGIDIAVELCLYCMKTQIFIDGNKRASVIFANHYLIGQGQGFLVIPEKEVPEFKKLLVAYYEGKNGDIIKKFMKEKCWKTF